MRLLKRATSRNTRVCLHHKLYLGLLKYTLAYPNKPFEDLEVARKWTHEFVQWYNGEHRHSAIQYVTPNERHSGQDSEVLEKKGGFSDRKREKSTVVKQYQGLVFSD